MDLDQVLCKSTSVPLFNGANLINMRRPGMAINVQKTKKGPHPNCLAIKPVGAETRTLGTPMRLLNKAYWVAVNFLCVMLAMKATKAEVPMPPVKFSNAMTPDKAPTWYPILARTANPAVETA